MLSVNASSILVVICRTSYLRLKLSFCSAESAVGLTCLSVCVSVMIPGVADGGTSRLWCGGPNGQAGASALGCSN